MEKQTKTIGIIHAVNLTIRAMQPFLERYIPDVEVVHLCDDTIQRDNIAAGVGVIPKRNYFKFAQYAYNLQDAGVDLILLACSTFNYAAELARPMIDIPIMHSLIDDLQRWVDVHLRRCDPSSLPAVDEVQSPSGAS